MFPKGSEEDGEVMDGPPTGTVTFLFTDREGSTKMWERDSRAVSEALARHDEILKVAIEERRGYVFKTVGDAFCAAFPTAPKALQAALEAQRGLLCFFPDASFNTLVRDVARSDSEIRRAVRERLRGL